MSRGSGAGVSIDWCITGSACRFRSSSFYELAQISNFATTRVAHSIWKYLRVLYQLQSYLPTNIAKNDAKTIFTFWRLEKIFRRRMTLFASDISVFNFKRNAANPAVVTRTFFRHLNIVALHVYYLFLSEVDFIFRYGITSFSLAYDSLPEKRSSDINWWAFLNLTASAGRRFSFPLPAPHPSDILSFSPQFSQSAVNPK